jgi:poly-gamma-glutamate synthesis protein (capsule biosynthesis protein)
MLSDLRCFGFWIFALLSAGVLRAQHRDPVWSLAATGDSIITRRISVYDDPPFLNLVQLIRGADVAFTNLECQLLRLWEFQGYPQAQHGGGYELGPPEAGEDLKWAGFDLLNRANNHTTDYGIEGMLETSRLLDSLGLVHAGTGMSLGEATQAKYLETAKGRFALIGLASTFNPGARAGEPRSEIKGRPGLNPLRVDRRYQLDPARKAELRRVVGALGGALPQTKDEPLRFGRLTFVEGPETRVLETVNPHDEDRILRSVRSAARQADFVIVNSHSHESGRTPEEPPEFIMSFARKCIDAGAATYIIHGPHRLRGIEIYKGRPIFYSLADFIFQYETTEPQAADIYHDFGVFDPKALAGDLYEEDVQREDYGPRNPEWWESVVAVPVFRALSLIEMKLYPIELGHKTAPIIGDGRAQRGTPRLASEPLSREIIEHLAQLSAPLGTRIVYREGIGVWEPDGASTNPPH